MPFPASPLASVTALLVAVLAFGVASLLQAMAARQPGTDERAGGRSGGGAGTRAQPRSAAASLMLGGLALDVVGFGAGAAALRDLPLFFVQGASAASLLVTALLVAAVLGERPSRVEATAMPLVLAGLVALALSAEPGPARALPTPVAVGLIVAAPLFAMLAWHCQRLDGHWPATALCVLSGLAYGSASLAARGMTAMRHDDLLFPALVVAVTAHAVLGVALVTVAMQRMPVNAVTSLLFSIETAAPAALGILLLGDRPAPGWAWITALGCALLVCSTGLLTAAGRTAPAVRPAWAPSGTAAERAPAVVRTPG